MKELTANPLSIREAARRLAWGHRTYIMGILNVTPDSFSDGGRYQTVDAAVRQALRMIEDGADIVDIGGESTRPGASEVSLEEELDRVLPVIRQLSRMTDVPLSIDTYKAEVAREALKHGAHIINDVWGGLRDEQMTSVAAEYDCPLILMHNQADEQYGDLLEDIIAHLLMCVKKAIDAGVRKERILLDPGIGFGKSRAQDLEVLGRLEEIAGLGYPVLLGTSRKRVIRHVLNALPDDVVEGTAATVSLGIAKGCQAVRVHDVRAIKRTAMMADAVVRGRW